MIEAVWENVRCAVDCLTVAIHIKTDMKSEFLIIKLYKCAVVTF